MELTSLQESDSTQICKYHMRCEAVSAMKKNKQESGIESPGVSWSLFYIGRSLIRELSLISGMPLGLHGVSKQPCPLEQSVSTL